MTQRTACGDIRIHAFHAEIELRNFRQMRKVQTPSNGGSIPIRDGTELIFGECVTIECHPITEFRQTIRPIHTGTTVTRILGSARQSIANPKNTMSECCKRQWNAGPTLDSGSRKSKFEISGGLEAESFPVKEWLRLIFHSKTARGSEVGTSSKMLSGQLSEKKLHAHRPQEPRNQRNGKWSYAIHPEHVDRGGIVAKHNRAALARSPIQALAAKAEFPIGQIQAYISIQHLKFLNGRRAGRGWNSRQLICEGYELACRKRQCRNRRGTLQLSSKIPSPGASSCVERKTRRGVPAFAKRSTEIVDLSFCKMVTVVERHPRNVPHARVHRLKAGLRFGGSRIKFGRKFSFKLAIDFSRRRVRQRNAFARLADQTCALASRPWTHSAKPAVNQANARKAVEGRVDPAVEGDVRRATISR